ncbi:MAG: hypothetical protein ACJ8C4_15555 [Gemmataceae bacterium]
MGHRALSPDSVRFDAQADAILCFGAADVLTASRGEACLYQCGEYADELKRLNDIAKQLGLPVRDGLTGARSGPEYFGKDID